jgi:thiamine-monophosphate kinase
MSNGEDAMTSWFADQRKLPEDKFPIGIGDDMAQIIPGGDGSVLITTDMLLEGTHFDLESASLEQVGYKGMAVSLSDCAGMVTKPLAAVVSVGLPTNFEQKQLKQLHKGIVKASDKYDCPLVGGDITVWKKDGGLVINSTILSEPAAGKPLLRSGAKVGDCICVTGKLGGSGEGRHLEFRPRVEEAIKAAGIAKLNSGMDLSDGLSSDLKRICEKSKVGAVIEEQSIPVSDEAGKRENPLEAALCDGEDFELLFTLAESEYEKLKSKWDDKLEISCIGRITEKQDIMIISSDGKLEPLPAGGYDHFKKGWQG